MTINLPQLPSMRCDSGCGDCCGPVAVGQAEFVRISAVVKRTGVTPQRNGILTCPLYIEGKCSVYHARPLICKLFGHSDDLKCSRGYNANADARTRRKWDLAIGRGAIAGIRMLHELAYTMEEIESMMKDVAKC